MNTLQSDNPSLLEDQLASSEGSASGVASEVARSLPHLDRMGRQLEQTSKQIEDSVVAVCGSFQAIAERARSAVAKTSGFLTAEGGNGTSRQSFDQLIASCGRTMVRILDTTEEAAQISRRAIERVQRMDLSTQQISTALSKLDRIAHENKMLAMNARIEAAHAGDAGAGFAVVAVEVVSQTEKTKGVTLQVSELIEELRSMANSTVRDLELMIDQDRKHLEECRLEVNRSLEAMQATHNALEHVVGSLTSESGELANEIGSAVRGLQFQDRTSQQIAHVVADLKTVHEKLAAQIGDAVNHHDISHEGFSAFTMHEERVVAGLASSETPAGEVELF